MKVEVVRKITYLIDVDDEYSKDPTSIRNFIMSEIEMFPDIDKKEDTLEIRIPQNDSEDS